jgi:hypothetical protein
MSGKMQEKAFAKKVRQSPEFVNWLLSKTKFKGVDAEPTLIRSDNPWYQSLKTGRQSETDILIVFERRDRTQRFALHIENKQAKETFRPDQPELYHERASDWTNMPKWGSYQDYEVILIAPHMFYARHKEKADIFHRYVPHEEIAKFIPEFSAISRSQAI